MSEISPKPLESQEGETKQFNPTKAKRVMPGNTLAKGSLPHYKNKGPESTADELLTIWLKLGF